jgi:RNA polymerase subunit RPABC4/transcription elongation factor Spt4
MSQTHLYQFIGVPISATTQEIDTAILAKYNEFRRLVTHHDQNIVTQATVALQTLEQARGILLNPQQRASYDQSLGLTSGTGGLADPSSLLNRLTGASSSVSMPPVAMAPLASQSTRPLNQPPNPGERLDAWVCNRCRVVNPIGTRFCKQCGNQVGMDCPKCGRLMEANSQFCQECGVNVREYLVVQEEEERMRAMEIAQRQRMEAERLAMLGPIVSNSNNAWSLTKVGCFLYFIPVVNLISLVLWGMGIYYARKVLASGQLPGDTEYREKAKKALGWASVPMILNVIGIGIYIVVLILQLLVSMGNY